MSVGAFQIHPADRHRKCVDRYRTVSPKRLHIDCQVFFVHPEAALHCPVLVYLFLTDMNGIARARDMQMHIRQARRQAGIDILLKKSDGAVGFSEIR